MGKSWCLPTQKSFISDSEREVPNSKGNGRFGRSWCLQSEASNVQTRRGTKENLKKLGNSIFYLSNLLRCLFIDLVGQRIFSKINVLFLLDLLNSSNCKVA